MSLSVIHTLDTVGDRLFCLLQEQLQASTAARSNFAFYGGVHGDACNTNGLDLVKMKKVGSEKRNLKWSRLDRITDWSEKARDARYLVGPLATKLGISTRHMQRYLFERFQKSPREFLRMLQMEAAVEHLSDSKAIKVVSMELGFRQVSHFSRCFKQTFGKSPTAFLATRYAVTNCPAQITNVFLG